MARNLVRLPLRPSACRGDRWSVAQAPRPGLAGSVWAPRPRRRLPCPARWTPSRAWVLLRPRPRWPCPRATATRAALRRRAPRRRLRLASCFKASCGLRHRSCLARSSPRLTWMRGAWIASLLPPWVWVSTGNQAACLGGRSAGHPLMWLACCHARRRRWRARCPCSRPHAARSRPSFRVLFLRLRHSLALWSCPCVPWASTSAMC